MLAEAAAIGDHGEVMASRDPHRGATEIVVFGRHPVLDALASEHVEVSLVRFAKGTPTQDRKLLVSACRERDVSIEEVSREELSRWTHAARHDQGIAARIRLLAVTEVDAFLAAATGRSARRPLRLLALDGVTNSQNVGMVVRSVVGAGLDGLVWPTVGQPWVNGLVVRAAVGSVFACPILRCGSLVEGLAALQAAGFSLYGLDAGGDRDLFAVEPDHRSVFVLGSEARGLSDDVAGMIDERLSIPMAGPLESLNVAVAAGLVAYHAAGLTRGGRR